MMLKGIDPLVSPDLLNVIASMGHGDELAIVDANFPAASMARRLLRLDGVSAPRALQAVLSLMPLDDFVESPLAVMEVVGDPEALPHPVKEFQQVADAAEGRKVKRERLERFAFYERAKAAFAILATGETRLYGCVMVKKGVIRPK
jgi:L-fucose mutarotase